MKIASRSEMIKKIIAIDPGNIKSALLVWHKGEIEDKFIVSNQEVLNFLSSFSDGGYTLVIEMIASYGMPVGQTIFDTCVWIGRFVQLWNSRGYKWDLMYRKNVKMHLCHNMRAKDSNIRQAIIDKYPANGGGKCPQVGTKGSPGLLYGITADLWAALGIAITYEEKR